MNISIGDNLKQMRLQKGLTQEQIAEVFSVSPQAISRWENNTAYPDITLLPGLAIFYDVTIDELIGMELIRKTETLEKIHFDAQSLVAEGKYEDAIELLRSSLRMYPNNGGLLVELAETLSQQANTPEALDEAIQASEQVLKNRTISIKASSTVVANLLFLYRKAGQMEKASALIQTLPHFWESREILAPEAYDGYKYNVALAEAIKHILSFICKRIESPFSSQKTIPDYIQIGFHPDRNANSEKLLKTIKSFLETYET